MPVVQGQRLPERAAVGCWLGEEFGAGWAAGVQVVAL